MSDQLVLCCLRLEKLSIAEVISALVEDEDLDDTVISDALDIIRNRRSKNT